MAVLDKESCTEDAAWSHGAIKGVTCDSKVRKITRLYAIKNSICKKIMEGVCSAVKFVFPINYGASSQSLFEMILRDFMKLKMVYIAIRYHLD